MSSCKHIAQVSSVVYDTVLSIKSGTGKCIEMVISFWVLSKFYLRFLLSIYYHQLLCVSVQGSGDSNSLQKKSYKNSVNESGMRFQDWRITKTWIKYSPGASDWLQRLYHCIQFTALYLNYTIKNQLTFSFTPDIKMLVSHNENRPKLQFLAKKKDMYMCIHFSQCDQIILHTTL